MFDDTKLPPIEAFASYESEESHWRYDFIFSPEYTAGSGDGTQPDSSVLAEYARPPTRRRPNSSPALKMASRIRSCSAYGPNNSYPGWPAMPCRSARTGLPAMVT